MATNVSRTRSRWVRLGLLAVALLLVGGAVGVVRTFPPTTAPIYPKCQLHTLTGLHCPGCGLTRCAHALTEGNVEQALAWNAFGFVMLPLFGWLLGKLLWDTIWGTPPSRTAPRFVGLKKWISIVGVGVLLTFGVLRNLPYEPFTLLAPHVVPR